MVLYFDHAASSPLHPHVAQILAGHWGHVGNPSATHQAGRQARRVIEDHRDQLAEALGATGRQLIWTSGGTESNNLAVKGLFAARHRNGERPIVITSPTEHPAVLDPVRSLITTHGAQVRWAQPDTHGRVTAQALAEAIGDDAERVALVSFMWANNETGVLNPIADLAGYCHAQQIPLHVDGAQAVGRVPINLADPALEGVCALSVTGHKLGGPVGIGALVLPRFGAPGPMRHLWPIAQQHGGMQERGARSGTLNLCGAVGLASVVSHSVEQMMAERDRLEQFRHQICTAVSQWEIAVTGAELDVTQRLSNIVHLQIPGAPVAALLYALDAAGVCVSAGSACSSGADRGSHVVAALGLPGPEGFSVLRISFGHSTTQDEVDRLLELLPSCIDQVRAMPTDVFIPTDVADPVAH